MLKAEQKTQVPGANTIAIAVREYRWSRGVTFGMFDALRITKE